MKTMRMNALIIDQDPEALKQFANVIKDLFNKIYISSNMADALKEFETIKPQVVYFNFGITQRNLQFEILSKLLALAPNPMPIFFGYCDSIEPELLTHALENGIHDLFARPFDADIISTKITRYYQSEKTGNRELNYSQLRPPLPVSIKMKFKISSVDESGITFKGSHYVSKGTTLPIDSPIIEEIFNSKSLEFIVTRTWVSNDWNDYYFLAEPKDGKEHLSTNLRKFILGKI